MRASFQLLISGQPSEVRDAFGVLHELLSERGFFCEEDFELIRTRDEGAIMRFHTVSALQAATALLPTLGVFTVVTNPELNY